MIDVFAPLAFGYVQTLKVALTSAPVLAYADYSKPFILEIDASFQGVRAILSQEYKGKCRPVAYLSRGLRPAEHNVRNCSSMKLEFVFIKYKPGRNNGNADALSRQNSTPLVELASIAVVPKQIRQSVTDQVQVCRVNGVSVFPRPLKENLGVLQEADPVIGRFMVSWDHKQPPTSQERSLKQPAVLELVRQWEKFEKVDGVLYRQFWPHDDHGHQGMERIARLVRTRCYWPGMYRYVDDWCRKCQRCTLSKVVRLKVRTFMGHLIADRPLDILAIDLKFLEPSISGIK